MTALFTRTRDQDPDDDDDDGDGDHDLTLSRTLSASRTATKPRISCSPPSRGLALVVPAVAHFTSLDLRLLFRHVNKHLMILSHFSPSVRRA